MENRYNVLLIEDDEDDYILFRDLLSETRDMKIELQWIAEYAEGLKVILQNRHDVYFLNYRLGERTGLELLKEAIANNADGPFIFLTGTGNREVDIAAMKTGASDFLLKSGITPDSLERSIRYTVENKKAEIERKKLIARLQEKTDEINTILESIGDGIVSIDQNYIITSINNAFTELAGMAKDDIIGKPCYEILNCNDEKGHNLCKKNCGLKQTLKKGQSSIGRTVIQHSEGSFLTIESINSPLRSADGSIIGAVKAIRDVTKEVEVERMKNKFISTVSHELRTPLTPIQGYIDLILSGDTGEINDLQREFLYLVSQNTERLSMLINDLLDIEKIESGKVTLDLKKVSFSDLVLHAVKTMEPQAKKKELDFITDIQDGVEGYADPDRITQILSNLVSNAIKFTPEGSITIKLHAHSGKAEISVIDTGIGISASDQKKLFTKFFRAEDANTRKAGGTGLGLLIVKNLVEMHKGEIIVKSTLHKGSEFQVIIPLKKITEQTNNKNS